MEVTRVRRPVDELANAALLLDAAAWMPTTPRRPADGDPQRHRSRSNLDAVCQLLRRLFSAACYQSADTPDSRIYDPLSGVSAAGVS